MNTIVRIVPTMGNRGTGYTCGKCHVGLTYMHRVDVKTGKIFRRFFCGCGPHEETEVKCTK